MPQQDDTIQIPNAPWWEAHSYVLVKEDFTAKDEAWIQNQLTQVKGMGTNKAAMDMLIGDIRIKTVQRMCTGGIVAVKRRSGRIKTVNLPGEAGDLLQNDMDYIYKQIDALNPDMTEDEAESFLPSANGRSETHLEVVR